MQAPEGSSIGMFVIGDEQRIIVADPPSASVHCPGVVHGMMLKLAVAWENCTYGYSVDSNSTLTDAPAPPAGPRLVSGVPASPPAYPAGVLSTFTQNSGLVIA
jgi:hypothetical protein